MVVERPVIVEQLVVVERRGRVMASSLHLIAVGPNAEVLERGLDDAVEYLAHLERCWSRFLPTSDICRINRLGMVGGGSITLDTSTIALLDVMVEGYQRTAGRFDPSVLPAVLAEGYTTSWVDPAIMVEVSERPTVWSAGLLHDIDLDPSTNTAMIPSDLSLDPGGIGKGFAADLAIARLVAAGATGAMAEIGGDLSMCGTSADAAGWLVSVERPDPGDGLLCSLAISGGGVATSSTRSRRWTVDGVEHHHQIDPATERSSTTDLEAVTVIAPTGWLAEVHSTAAVGIGSTGVLAYLEGHGFSGIAFVRDDSSVLMTADLAGIQLRPMAGVR